MYLGGRSQLPQLNTARVDHVKRSRVDVAVRAHAVVLCQRSFDLSLGDHL